MYKLIFRAVFMVLILVFLAMLALGLLAIHFLPSPEISRHDLLLYLGLAAVAVFCIAFFISKFQCFFIHSVSF